MTNLTVGSDCAFLVSRKMYQTKKLKRWLDGWRLTDLKVCASRFHGEGGYAQMRLASSRRACIGSIWNWALWRCQRLPASFSFCPPSLSFGVQTLLKRGECNPNKRSIRASVEKCKVRDNVLKISSDLSEVDLGICRVTSSTAVSRDLRDLMSPG